MWVGMSRCVFAVVKDSSGMFEKVLPCEPIKDTSLHSVTQNGMSSNPWGKPGSPEPACVDAFQLVTPLFQQAVVWHDMLCDFPHLLAPHIPKY